MIFNLRPFITPNFVMMKMPSSSRGSGWQQLPSVPLVDVDAQDLSEMCDAFRAEIFKKAGKKDPRSAK